MIVAKVSNVLDSDIFGNGELVLVLDEVGQCRSFVTAAIDRDVGEGSCLDIRRRRATFSMQIEVNIIKNRL